MLKYIYIAIISMFFIQQFSYSYDKVQINYMNGVKKYSTNDGKTWNYIKYDKIEIQHPNFKKISYDMGKTWEKENLISSFHSYYLQGEYFNLMLLGIDLYNVKTIHLFNENLTKLRDIMLDSHIIDFTDLDKGSYFLNINATTCIKFVRIVIN